MRVHLILAALCVGLLSAWVIAAESRRPENDEQLRYWLTNMVAYHRFTPDEVHAATGLALPEVDAALKRFDIIAGTVPPR